MSNDSLTLIATFLSLFIQQKNINDSFSILYTSVYSLRSHTLLLHFFETIFLSAVGANEILSYCWNKMRNINCVCQIKWMT